MLTMLLHPTGRRIPCQSGSLFVPALLSRFASSVDSDPRSLNAVYQPDATSDWKIAGEHMFKIPLALLSIADILESYLVLPPTASCTFSIN